MDDNPVITCLSSHDENICTVIIKYRVCRNDRGKLFGRLLVLKHKVENFLKEFVDDETILQNPLIQRTKDGLVDLFQGLTSLCSGISPSREMLTIPELPNNENESIDKNYEMKFVKGTSPNDMWLCYVNNGEFLNLLQHLRDKYDNDELDPFIFYPNLGEHVYFKQGGNIFRGIVQEYVIPENCKDEESVDVKVLNIDNSDVIVLPQNCFFHMNKEGTSVPMQCVLCAVEDIKNETQDESRTPSNVSLASMKKYKLNVRFQRKKLSVSGSPVDAQSVSITYSSSRLKDKNNFNVNSKEFIPRSNQVNTPGEANGIPDIDSKSDQSTRSSSPTNFSSQEGVSKGKSIDVPVSELSLKDSGNASGGEYTSKKPTTGQQSPVVPVNLSKTKNNESKGNTEIKVNHSNQASPTLVVSSPKSITNRPIYEKERHVYGGSNKDYRYNVNKYTDKLNKSMPVVLEKFKHHSRISSPSNNNELRNKSGPSSTSSQPSSHTQSPASLPPNTQVPPYLFPSVPQFPPGPIHFSGQYVPLPTPQQLNSAVPFHFPQYPYAAAATPAYISSAAPQSTSHSQYHLPPASSHYQSYMQPVAMSPFFSSQPPFSQQFYQPTHLQPACSHLQPSFQVSGIHQQSIASHNQNSVTAVNMVKKSNIGKIDYNSSVSNLK